MKLLQKGNKNRTVEATAANKTSSRSHALLQVLVEQEDKFTGTKTKRKFGKLFMIDLAGSERASQTKNEGKRLQEGAHINRSLLALANCINALAQGDAKYVNFRDSKLTRLLKDALSGNCRTVMIAHVSPNPDHRDETYNTLVYADRAKNISNKVRKNVVDVEHHVSQYQNIIEELKGEISRLREKLEGGGEPSKDAVDATFKDRKAQEAHRVKLKALQEQLVANFKDQMDVRQEMLDVENNILALAMEREKEQLIIDEWEAEKTKKKSAMKKGKPSSSSSSNQSGESSAAGGPPVGRQWVAGEDSESDVEMEEPEEVAQAWDEIMFINNEEKRYLEMKEDLEKELEEARHKSAALEAEFPQEITDSEQREIYSLLLRVHELEVERVEMQRDALLREHEMRKKELMLLRFDMQRNLCDQIITRQRELLKAHQSQTPEDLDQLYQVYKNESYGATREKDAKLIAQLNEFIRVVVDCGDPAENDTVFDEGVRHPRHPRLRLRLRLRNQPQTSAHQRIQTGLVDGRLRIDRRRLATSPCVCDDVFINFLRFIGNFFERECDGIACRGLCESLIALK
ncbi:unnamed protein product [Darwinula stevensoni]|uniref:Kinesin-like protein n=1 Tax=Darwinula stevensoni TaxID=69355 RepID=A0A7R9A5L6_9CRUS|nr:unnamed protein product [Darwinula stevensoni]CAG0892328.1 unnamed protein product [Darwinula stevensoni]